MPCSYKRLRFCNHEIPARFIVWLGAAGHCRISLYFLRLGKEMKSVLRNPQCQRNENMHKKEMYFQFMQVSGVYALNEAC